MLIEGFRRLLWALGLIVASFHYPAWAGGDGAIAYTADPGQALKEGAVPIDARALSACRARSLPGARCLPAADFLGPHGRLASIRDMLWLIGAAGLSGNEHVLVIGNAPRERDFVAGILYLAGQKKISILTQPVARGGGLDKDALVPGEERAATRQAVFQAPMRDDLIVLRGELASAMRRGNPPVLLDGRTDEEYWGKTVRGLRGGHIPGAQHVPARVLRSAVAGGRAVVTDAAEPVAYGHDALEGVAFLTLLTAGAGVRARVYLEGWSDWAATTALPADSVTYPDRMKPDPMKTAAAPPPAAAAGISWPLLIAAAFAGGGLVFGGFMVGKRSAG